MRKLCLVVLLLAACKEKQEAKPAPAAEQKQTTVEPKPALPSEPADQTKPPPTPVQVKPAGGYTTAIEYENKAFELVDKLTAVFTSAGTNCEKLADGLELFVNDHRATF